ncbi:hypothetical protein BBJ29_009717 [Phytophthora kernoviae]|uniref:Uncharacterized protein n=1 Tax=Phytophthora kernoviae TaxID=325452 RepID=A0A3F2RDV5_9STRA|nr:hypothetical protein BBP00_00009668 [Phytophthora kernoviae]RLN58836.1 hypothetical protein BBJ29_009717 [Phytophthora kernoviae]
MEYLVNVSIPVCVNSTRFVEVPYLIGVIILFMAIEYWLVGWSDNAGDFFFFNVRLLPVHVSMHFVHG